MNRTTVVRRAHTPEAGRRLSSFAVQAKGRDQVFVIVGSMAWRERGSNFVYLASARSNRIASYFLHAVAGEGTGCGVSLTHGDKSQMS